MQIPKSHSLPYHDAESVEQGWGPVISIFSKLPS